MGNESVGGAGGSGGQGGVFGAGGQSYGGNVVSYGQVSITSSVFLFGVAKGGAGGAGVTGGAGGSAQGGSLDRNDGFAVVPPTFEAICTVTCSTVSGALARGGSGGSGGASCAAGAGGLAQGGGIAVPLPDTPEQLPGHGLRVHPLG